jgi:hypothetical protein
MSFDVPDIHPTDETKRRKDMLQLATVLPFCSRCRLAGGSERPTVVPNEPPFRVVIGIKRQHCLCDQCHPESVSRNAPRI